MRLLLLLAVSFIGSAQAQVTKAQLQAQWNMTCTAEAQRNPSTRQMCREYRARIDAMKDASADDDEDEDDDSKPAPRASGAIGDPSANSVQTMYERNCVLRQPTGQALRDCQRLESSGIVNRDSSRSSQSGSTRSQSSGSSRSGSGGSSSSSDDGGTPVDQYNRDCVTAAESKTDKTGEIVTTKYYFQNNCDRTMMIHSAFVKTDGSADSGVTPISAGKKDYIVCIAIRGKGCASMRGYRVTAGSR